MPELHILPTTEKAVQTMARFVADLAKERVAAQGQFAIALSGGSTPRLLYRILASPPHAPEIEWDKWRVFWSDERCVPADHEESNFTINNLKSANNPYHR